MNPRPPSMAEARLRAASQSSPAVVAHRGDSCHYPENTAEAFAAAAALGAPIQEFDVQVAACGTLVCLHDPTLDRTTDAARTLGPGALVAQLPYSRLKTLDAGAWKHARHAGSRIPTLERGLEAMLPSSLPMIEHKAGRAEQYVAELRRLGRIDDVVLQSFEWDFVENVRALAPELAVGLLGPTAAHAAIDDAVVAFAERVGACFVHWHAPRLTRVEVERAHGAGLLVVTYTSDDELSWHGGRSLGVDAMCSNDPGRMLQSLRLQA